MGKAARAVSLVAGLHSPSLPLPPEAAELWEATASWWQENFTEGADPEYAEQIIPFLKERLERAEPARVLDIGCGEGQLSRLAASTRSAPRVVGVDPTKAQLEAALAREARGPGTGEAGKPGTGEARKPGTGRLDQAGRHAPWYASYVRGSAQALPFPDATFDVAFACLVFEHIEGAAEALAEVGRVLRPGGTFLLFLNHPLLQAPGSGWVDDHILSEQYWRIGPYLPEHHGVEEVDKDVFVPFVHRPLSAYVNALVAAGLYITEMTEPPPPPGFLARAEEYAQAADYPRLLVLQAMKLVTVKA